MTTEAERNRENARNRATGEFGEHAHTAAEVTLDDQPDWGATTVHVGSRTPWGAADYVTDPAPGITTVGTPSHGGIKLSPERNRGIPVGLRNSNGWYEEDTEANIVGMFHPEAFPHIKDPGYFSPRVRDWHPDAWEQATGQTIQPGESFLRDESDFEKRHEGEWRLTSARSEGDTVKIIARRSESEKVEFTMPAADYDELRARPEERGQNGRLFVDPTGYEAVAPVPEPPKVPSVKYRDIVTPATPGAQNNLLKDLNKRWRDSDGRVRTLREEIEQDGVSGKGSSVDNNGRRTYYLHHKEFEGGGAYKVTPVTKATFDAVQAPDNRSPADIARQNVDIAQAAADRAYFPADREKASAKLRAAEQVLKQKREEALDEV